jgi:hypothetical protein
MTRKSKFILATWFSLICLAAGSCFSQTPTTGALTGTVKDSSGAVLPGVEVTVTNEATGVKRIVKTDGAGAYLVGLLSPGSYTVEFSGPGFKVQKQPGTLINVTETARLDVALQVGTQTEEITVQGQAGLLQTETSTLGRVVGGQTVEGMPLVNRNYTQILNLYPGVQADVNNAGQLGRNSPDLWVNGGRAIDNSYSMDGAHVDNFGAAKAGDWLGYSGISIPNPDAIQEFKVQTSLYDAGYGRSSGANVNVVTKSGTNQFHGDVFEFFRNNVLNANDFFLKRNNQSRPVLKQNQFGGILGGPVKKDKLFFFASYQGTRQRNGLGDQSLQSAFLPPLTNDRSAATLGAKFCPQRGSLGGVAIACNGSNINPVALALLNRKLPDGRFVIPTPQVIQSSGTGVSVFSEVSKFTEDQVIGNMDFVQSSRNTWSGRWFWSRDPQISAFTRTGSNIPGSGGLNNFRNQNFVLRLTSIITPTIVNEAKLSFLRNSGSLFNLQPTKTTDVGMTGPGQIEVLPQIIVQGLFTLGGNNNDFFNTAVTGGGLADQVSLVRGKHNIRVGFEVGPTRDNFDLYGNKRGSLTFRSFADFLLGMSAAQNGSQFSNVFTSSALNGPTDRQYRVMDYAGFVQDDYKIANQLTLNLGFRWDHFGGVSEARGFLTNFNPALAINPPPAAGTLAGYIVPDNFPASILSSVGNSEVIKTGNNNCCAHETTNFWGPRVGLAWQPLHSSRLVVRSGYGIFYSRLSGNDFLQLLLEPPFNINAALSGVDNARATFQVPFNPPLPTVPVWPRTFPNTVQGSRSFLADNLRTPSTQQWSLNTQIEIISDLLLEVGYVGGHGTHVYGTRDVNTPLLASVANPVRGITTNTVANAPSRVPYLGYSSLLINETAGTTSYNGLQSSLTKRFSHGLQFLASYTWSKTLDDLSNTTVSFDSGRGGRFPGDGNFSRRRAWGPADFDRKNRLVFSYVWDLPKIRGGNGVLGKILSGWQSSGVATFQSGTPVPIQDQRAGSIIAFRTSGFRYGQACPGVTNDQLVSHGSVDDRLSNYMIASQFCPPPVIGDGFYLGTIGRDAVRGPDQRNFDLSIGKRFKAPGWKEGATMEFRSEFFNAFNTPQFANPAATLPLATFGQITATTVAPRIVQFALKYTF